MHLVDSIELAAVLCGDHEPTVQVEGEIDSRGKQSPSFIKRPDIKALCEADIAGSVVSVHKGEDIHTAERDSRRPASTTHRDRFRYAKPRFAAEEIRVFIMYVEV